MPDHAPAPASALSPARWSAAGFLGGASIIGMLWAIMGRAPADHPSPPPPQRTALVTPPTVSAESASRPVPGRTPDVTPERISPEPAPIVFEHPAAASSTASVDPEPTKPDPAPTPAPAPANTERININTATLSELELLPRIGPTLGARIIEFRAREGRIRSFTHLMDVKGIGVRTAERLEAYIRFE